MQVKQVKLNGKLGTTLRLAGTVLAGLLGAANQASKQFSVFAMLDGTPGVRYDAMAGDCLP